MNFAMSQQAAPNPYNMQFGNQSNPISYGNSMQNMQAPLMQNNMQAPPLFQQMPMNPFNPMNPLIQRMPPKSDPYLDQLIMPPNNNQ